MKIKLKIAKTPHPLVAAAHVRRAGAQRPHGGAMRQVSRRTLRRELDQLTRPKPSP